LLVADALRVPRATRRRIADLWAMAVAVAPLERAPASRAQRVRWMRRAEFEPALALARAWCAAQDRACPAAEELERERASLSPSALEARALLSATDLERAGVPRGPLWGALLEEAETLWLDEVLGSREQALEWLARRAHEVTQEGGKTLRKAKDK